MWLLGIEFRVSDRCGQPHLLSPCSLGSKDIFIIISKYTVAVLRPTRRGASDLCDGCEMVVSHVVAEI